MSLSRSRIWADLLVSEEREENAMCSADDTDLLDVERYAKGRPRVSHSELTRWCDISCLHRDEKGAAKRSSETMQHCAGYHPLLRLEVQIALVLCADVLLCSPHRRAVLGSSTLLPRLLPDPDVVGKTQTRPNANEGAIDGFVTLRAIVANSADERRHAPAALSGPIVPSCDLNLSMRYAPPCRDLTDDKKIECLAHAVHVFGLHLEAHEYTGLHTR